jgi:L-alanine-DL-glutamate epimerase-like enolase superfamily enzyme
MAKSTDIVVKESEVFFLPVQTRVPLKFGPETLTSVTLARVRVRVEDRRGRSAEGWGETPLSVQWVWPSGDPYEPRHRALKDLVVDLGKAFASFGEAGHPIEIGQSFVEGELRRCWQGTGRDGQPGMPWLAALVSFSPFDIATHDAYGNLLGMPAYRTYGPDHMNRDLAGYLRPAEGGAVSFKGLYPRDFVAEAPAQKLRAWHLVGGKDLIEPTELTGGEPDDGYPVLLRDWIDRDGLKCLKVKLTGTDAEWDARRLAQVGRIGREKGAEWLSADFNCTVSEPRYVNDILDRMIADEPATYGMILYVEQPFPYDLEQHQIDVHSVAARKPLFMDESAHDWRLIRLGRSLGWTGVALKTCKTQSGALLSLCWAKAHGMTLMVQDLTNPMLAQIPHVLLAAHAGTIMGVETNAMQFYPEASRPEAAVHPGLYSRRAGTVDLSTLRGPGFGYRISEIARSLPAAAS